MRYQKIQVSDAVEDNKNSHKVKILKNQVILINDAVFYARPLEPQSKISVINEGKINYVFTEENRAFLLISRNELQVILTGEWDIEVFKLMKVATLLSFVGYYNENNKKKSPEIKECHNSSLDKEEITVFQDNSYLAVSMEDRYENFLDMVMKNVLNMQSLLLEKIFDFMRGLEGYWISTFLLAQIMGKGESEQKLYNASKKYGVSTSYFRRLCQNTFSRNPKVQMRLWRAAHSALELIDNDDPISTVASNNGYSSSSHFSSEIKSLLGFSPRNFKRLEGIFYE